MPDVPEVVEPEAPGHRDDVLTRLDQFQSEARARGVTRTTFRHLTEALNLSGSQRDELRQLLIHSRPDQYDAPLWNIGA